MPCRPLYCLGVTLCLLMRWAGEGATAQSFTPTKLQPANLRKADSTYRQAIAFHDSLRLAEAYYLYGRSYWIAGAYLQAKNWFLKSLRIQEARGDSYEHGRLYLRLSDLEVSQWHHAEALRYAHQARVIFQRLRLQGALSKVAFRLARIHIGVANRNAANLDSTVYYLRRAEQSALLAKGEPLLMADVHELWGQVWLAKRRPEAIGHLREAVRLHRQYSQPGMQIKSSLNLASAYLSLGQPRPARLLLDQIQHLYTEQHRNEYDTRLSLEAVTTAYYQAIGDWKSAFQHQTQIHQVEKTGLIADREGAITRLSVEFETAKKEARLSAQQQELNLRAQAQRVERGALIALALLLVVTATFSVVFYRLNRKNHRISRRNAELVKEQNHRVKNNLQVVSSLLNLYADRLSDPLSRQAVEESQLRVETMALLQRRLYDGDRLATVEASEFIPELVEGVLQSYRYEHLQPHFTLTACELSADQALALGLIVNELTTNACKYAFPHRAKPTFALALTRNETHLALTVADNGPGLPPALRRNGKEPGENTASFGLRLVRMQVEQLRGLHRLSSDHGTRFWMTFPLVS